MLDRPVFQEALLLIIRFCLMLLYYSDATREEEGWRTNLVAVCCGGMNSINLLIVQKSFFAITVRTVFDVSFSNFSDYFIDMQYRQFIYFVITWLGLFAVTTCTTVFCWLRWSSWYAKSLSPRTFHICDILLLFVLHFTWAIQECLVCILCGCRWWLSRCLLGVVVDIIFMIPHCGWGCCRWYITCTCSIGSVYLSHCQCIIVLCNLGDHYESWRERYKSSDVSVERVLRSSIFSSFCQSEELIQCHPCARFTELRANQESILPDSRQRDAWVLVEALVLLEPHMKVEAVQFNAMVFFYHPNAYTALSSLASGPRDTASRDLVLRCAQAFQRHFYLHHNLEVTMYCSQPVCTGQFFNQFIRVHLLYQHF